MNHPLIWVEYYMSLHKFFSLSRVRTKKLCIILISSSHLISCNAMFIYLRQRDKGKICSLAYPKEVIKC